jgi:hypothetical protein
VRLANDTRIKILLVLAFVPFFVSTWWAIILVGVFATIVAFGSAGIQVGREMRRGWRHVTGGVRAAAAADPGGASSTMGWAGRHVLRAAAALGRGLRSLPGAMRGRRPGVRSQRGSDLDAAGPAARVAAAALAPFTALLEIIRGRRAALRARRRPAATPEPAAPLGGGTAPPPGFDGAPGAGDFRWRWFWLLWTRRPARSVLPDMSMCYDCLRWFARLAIRHRDVQVTPTLTERWNLCRDCWPLHDPPPPAVAPADPAAGALPAGDPAALPAPPVPAPGTPELDQAPARPALPAGGTMPAGEINIHSPYAARGALAGVPANAGAAASTHSQYMKLQALVAQGVAVMSGHADAMNAQLATVGAEGEDWDESRAIAAAVRDVGSAILAHAQEVDDIERPIVVARAAAGGVVETNDLPYYR